MENSQTNKSKDASLSTKDRLLCFTFIALFIGLPIIFGIYAARIVIPSLSPLLSFWNILRLACYVVPGMFLGFLFSLVLAFIIAAFLFTIPDKDKSMDSSDDSSTSEP